MLSNLEGGCYAKMDRLSVAREPLIFNAAQQFGAVMENVVFDPESRVVDFDNVSITVNTRCAYPVTYVPNSISPSISVAPSRIIFLTCDAFGVLPPVSLLSPMQTLYYFLSGYTAKTPHTEAGITEPIPVFSACFGEAFLPLHPIVCIFSVFFIKKMTQLYFCQKYWL